MKENLFDQDMSASTGTGALGARVGLVAAGAVVALWGVLGLVELGNWTYEGYRKNPSFEVIQVDEGAPADRAGLQVGDKLLTSGGISVTDAHSLSRRPRAAIGSTRVYEVARDSEELEIEITFEQLPPRYMALGWAAISIGLCFVGFGLWAFLTNPSGGTRLLAIVCVFLGLAFCEGPYFESYAARTITGMIVTTLVVLGFASLLHFMLVFPKPKRFLVRSGARLLLYAPAFSLALFILYRIAFQPDATSGLNRFTSLFVNGFFIFYFGLSVASMIVSFRRATPEERSALGLDFVLFSTLVGLLPMAISAVIRAAAPDVVLPGQEFYFLTMVLIPVSLALATRGWNPAEA